MQGFSLRKIISSGSSSLRRFDILSRYSIYSANPAYNFSFDPRQTQRPNHPQSNRQPNQPPEPAPAPKSSSRKLLLALAAVSGFALSYYQYINNAERKPEQRKEATREQKEAAPSGPKIGGTWRLIDLKGELITEKDFEGSYYLLYFGFCSCPDVCPQTLTEVSKAVEMLKKDESFPSKKLKTVFVSFDPDRDTPQKMEKFLDMFNTKIIGLRGLNNDDPHLKEMLKKYKILVLKLGSTGIQSESAQETQEAKDTNKGHYNLDHTVITYLMDKKNNCISMLSPTMTAIDMAENIKKAIEENK